MCFSFFVLYAKLVATSNHQNENLIYHIKVFSVMIRMIFTSFEMIVSVSGKNRLEIFEFKSYSEWVSIVRYI